MEKNPDKQEAEGQTPRVDDGWSLAQYGGHAAEGGNKMSAYRGGNHYKAYRIARELVKDIDPSDIEHTITEPMTNEEQLRILTAIEPKYDELDKRRIDICKEMSETLSIEEAKKLFGEYDEISLDLEFAKAMAWFHLGFAAASRLVSNPPSMQVMNGGVTELKPKLQGKCGL